MAEPKASRTVLVADDEPSLLRLIERLLIREGYAVLTTSDGVEAAANLGRAGSPIEVVVLDAGIPPDGWAAVLREVADEPTSPSVVLISGGALPSESQRLGPSPAAFLHKPFTVQALLRAVQDALPGS